MLRVYDKIMIKRHTVKNLNIIISLWIKFNPFDFILN